MPDYSELIDLAKKCGFTEAGPLDVARLEFLPEVRDMCRTCPGYGKYWSCPPGCGPLEEMCGKIKTYTQGLLVQTVGQIEDSYDWENMQQAEENHRESFLKLRDEMDALYPGHMTLGNGACRQCDACAYTEGKPCRTPERQTASMSAYGLLVNKVCADNGLAYNYGPETISYTSCFLLE